MEKVLHWWKSENWCIADCQKRRQGNSKSRSQWKLKGIWWYLHQRGRDCRNYWDAGGKAVAVHGRTRTVLFRKSRLVIIRQVKEAVSIPVIGNETLIRRKCNCDSKRDRLWWRDRKGSTGNPWIFQNFGNMSEPERCRYVRVWKAIKKMMIRHAQLQME